MAWLGIVACQIGTAFAVRTDHASLWSVGVFSNRFLLGGIGVELAFAALLIYCRRCRPSSAPRRSPRRSCSPSLPFPFIVWGADEIRRLPVVATSGGGPVPGGAPRAAGAAPRDNAA